MLSTGLAPITLLSGCLYSVTYDNGGYQRQGVFLPDTPPGPPPPTVTAPPGEGLDLHWRSELGVYAVEGHDATFYRLRRFYRCREGEWQIAEALGGPWHPPPDAEALPAALTAGAPCSSPSEGDTAGSAAGSQSQTRPRGASGVP